MQLYVIDWSFQNAEDQLFATNEFCENFKNLTMQRFKYKQVPKLIK